MREQTNLNGVKAVAKSLLMIDLHLTDYSPVMVLLNQYIGNISHELILNT